MGGELLVIVFLLIMLAAAITCWRDERRLRRADKTLLDEVEAYLTKRFGGR